MPNCIFLAIYIFFCYNDRENDKNVSIFTQTKTPDEQIGGFLFQFFKGGPAFRLTAHVLPIQPFANVVGNYTCHDG